MYHCFVKDTRSLMKAGRGFPWRLGVQGPVLQASPSEMTLRKKHLLYVNIKKRGFAYM